MCCPHVDRDKEAGNAAGALGSRELGSRELGSTTWRVEGAAYSSSLLSVSRARARERLKLCQGGLGWISGKGSSPEGAPREWAHPRGCHSSRSLDSVPSRKRKKIKMQGLFAIWSLFLPAGDGKPCKPFLLCQSLTLGWVKMLLSKEFLKK